MPQGLSRPVPVCTTVEFAPDVAAANCTLPPQTHDSTDENAVATVELRSLPPELAADYFNVAATPPPPRHTDLEERENIKLPTPKHDNNDDNIMCTLCRTDY